MKTLASLAAVLIVTAAGSASAQEARIRWGDLDLSTPAGADAFDQRVRAAARKMCRSKSIIGSTACRAAVRDEAVALLPRAAQVDYALSRVPFVEA